MNRLSKEHAIELQNSAIAPDIAALNFRSFDGVDENELDEVFTLLIPEPKHNNNGTLSGTSQQELAAIIRSGGWAFEGREGVCVKPDNPRKDKDGKKIKYESPRKDKDGKKIKYESPLGSGGLQLFIPRVSWAIGRKIAAKAGAVAEANYLERMGTNARPGDEDCGFWEWFLTAEIPLIITEGAKKCSSLVSSGYPAIALNGVWGWGTNDRDMFGNVEKDDRGKSAKTIHPDLDPFLDGREIVLAFDRDDKTKTVQMVESAKSRFAEKIAGDGITVTQMEWETGKGIDDYIVARGEKLLGEIYSKRSKVKPPKLPKKERVTTGDTLLEIARTAKYFHTADKVAYADIWIEGNRHTYAVRSKAFKLWLSEEYLNREGKGISSQILHDTLNTIEAIAIFQGETHEVHLRTAERDGKIYLDLGTPDWKAVEIEARGWSIVANPPVRFWRPESLLPLPYPVEGGKLDELEEFMNVDRSSWILLITFLLFCFCPNKTYPVLVISAHRGSGKTAAAEIIKGLIDPGKAPLIKLQGDTHKLAVAAARRLVMVYDNVGHISADQSDDICRMSTNFGYSTRTLHTTDEETTFEFARPQIITAIDALVTRDDLADRVLMAQLGEITEDQRIPQSELNAKVEAVRPRILGALLTALSQTLAELPRTNPEKLPRMADYALFAIASEKALGLNQGEFIEIFNESREQSRQIVVESSPVGEAIVSMMRDRLNWKGTATELMKELERHTDEATYRSRFYPKTPNLFKRQLNRLKPDLLSLGVSVSEIREGRERTRTLYLEKVIKTSSASSASSANHDKSRHSEGFAADDTADDKTCKADDNKSNTGDADDKRTIEKPVIVRAEVTQYQQLSKLADDADDADDKKGKLSGSDKSKNKIADWEVPEDEF